MIAEKFINDDAAAADDDAAHMHKLCPPGNNVKCGNPIATTASSRKK